MNTNTSHCPNCGHSLISSNQPNTRHKVSYSALNGVMGHFGMGQGDNVQTLPTRIIRKPRESLGIMHFVTSLYVSGAFTAIGFMFLALANRLNILLLTDTQLFIASALMFCTSYGVIFSLVNNSRYEERHEATTIKEIVKPVLVADKPQETVVIVDKTHREQRKFCKLPNGLTYKELQPIARAVVRNDFVFSRGSLVRQKLITDYTCRQLITLFIDRGILTKEGRKTVATSNGKRAFAVIAKHGIL